MMFSTKKGFKAFLETRRIRLKRKSGKIAREMVAVSILLGVVLVTGALMVFSYNYVLSSSYFHLEKAIVKGCEKTTEKDVISVSGIKPNQNLLAISMEGIARKVRTNPWVEDVSVVREFPNRLIIEIRERKPVALVKRDDSLFFMDGDGLIFKKLEGESTNLPVLTGCSENGKDDTLLIRKSIELIDFLSASKSFPQIRNVSEIHSDENMGFSLFLDSGLCLHIGFGDYENKLNRLKPIMTDLTRRNLDQGFLLIDLHDPGKITLQRKDIPGFSRPARGLKT